MVEGKSTSSKTRVILVPPSPGISGIFGGECEQDENGHPIPGYQFLVSGNGFTHDDNVIRIGPVKLDASSDDGKYVDALLPKSLAPGNYELSVENALGKSDGYSVVVVAPPPPQNVTTGKPTT